jgi:hypothetical protein
MDEKIVAFFLANSEKDNAEELTCRKFGISEETLNYILACDLHENFS